MESMAVAPGFDRAIAGTGPVFAASVIGLLAMIFASVAGTGFTSTGADSASMAMSVLTGIAMLCYAANLYLLRPGIRRG
jgi:hypothetical protein